MSGDPTLTLGLTTYAPDQRVALPAITGPTLAGPTLDLHSLRGSVVVLNVWASWCTECRNESPALAKLAADPRMSGVRFVGIDEQDKSEAARSFASAVGTTYPHLVDQDGSLLAKVPLVPSTAIPSTVVVDQDGRVAARVIGAVDVAALRKELLALQRTG
jgi:thiol-disulfide isomerase/thioredoxin